MDLPIQLQDPDVRKMNSNNIRFLFFVLITMSLAGQTTGQNKKDHQLPLRYTVDIKEKPLVELLDYLQNELSLPIAYAVDNLPEDITVSVSVVEAPIENLIVQICRHPQLYCIFTQGFYVIRSHIDATTMALVQEQPQIPGTIADQNSPKPYKEPTHRNVSTKELPPVLERLNLNSDEAPPNIKMDQKNACKLITPPKQTQKSKIALGLLYSMDFYQFHFREGMTSEQKFSAPWNQGWGCELMTSPLKKRYLLSLGIIYSIRDFAYIYNYHVLDLQDPIPIPDQTTIHMSYVECPLELGLIVLDKSPVHFSIAVGYMISFPVNEEETTIYQNFDPQHTAFYLLQQKTISSASLSFNLAYPLSNKMQIMLSPHYIQFFQAINEVAMESATQSLSIQSKILINL